MRDREVFAPQGTLEGAFGAFQYPLTLLLPEVVADFLLRPARDRDTQPVRRRSVLRAAVGQDFYPVAGMKRVGKRNDFTVDPRPGAAVPDLRVNVIGEVDGGAA